ncbi:MAG: transaldolase [Chloroflexi bacterium]|nr:transaldolase [Chloroflexota bacterium]
MVTPIQSLRDMGQSVWYDDISRAMIDSGGLKELIDNGVTGLTSNPTIFHKAITESSDYDDELMSLAEAGKDTREIFETMAIADIRDAADLLRPAFDGTGGADGFASFEVSPLLAHDTESTIHEARRLFSDIDRPNIMIKVPATPEGMPAIETLIGEGINVNVTLIFSLKSHSRVIDAYISGLERLEERGGDLSKVSSVASFFVSRVDTAVDNLLNALIAEGRDDLNPLLGRAAVANAHLAYHTFAQEFGTPRFAYLRRKGARVQRPLWASTSVKNPDYDDLLYVTSLMARDTVNTMPRATIDTLMERGIDAAHAIDDTTGEAAERVQAGLSDAGIDMDDVTSVLLADGVKAFADSYDMLMTDIEAASGKLAVGTGAD